MELLTVALFIGIALIAGGAAYFFLRKKKDDTPFNQPAPPPAIGGPTVDASKWVFQFSPNMPANPTAEEPGFSFRFPSVAGVHYLVTSVGIPAPQQSVSLSYTYSGDGTLIPDQADEPGPGHFSIMLQRRGDDLTANSPYHRWFSDKVLLQPETKEINVSMDPGSWTSVFGRRGTDNPNEFRAALADLEHIGLTFGGAYFAGHGLHANGEAKFHLHTISIA